ncbi:MAG: 30S ribosomal protein S5 [Candidatus Korarchaeota archaeon]
MKKIEAFDLESWTPKTYVGMMVKKGEIATIEDLFSRNLPITEPNISRALLPNLEEEVVYRSHVQKQTDAGERTRVATVVAIGNKDGYIGLGAGKGSEYGIALIKARSEALKSIFPVRRGCGSPECHCGMPHSVPFIVEGKQGSVRIKLIPAPRGTGLIVPRYVIPILQLAGIADAWSFTTGETRTTRNLIYATLDALKKTRKIEVYYK